MTIGILALQGDFAKHHEAFARCGVKSSEVRTNFDLQGIAGLVIPGGESTTLTKLMTDELRAGLIQFAESKPVWGTCAGMIMISQTESDVRVKPLGLMDIRVNRNGFGRQVHSFESPVRISEEMSPENKSAFDGIFIRAPRLESIGKKCIPLAWLGEEVVCVREKNYLASSFHPELTHDERLHRYFISLCR